jgi:hypothetical protein
MIQESAPHLYQNFWDEFIKYCRIHGTTLHLNSGSRRKHLPISIGKGGFSVNPDIYRKSQHVECTLWIDGYKAQAFSELKSREPEIVDKLRERMGERLGKVCFDKSQGGRAFKIFESMQCELSDRKAWPAAHKWLKEHCEAYVAVFTTIVKGL